MCHLQKGGEAVEAGRDFRVSMAVRFLVDRQRLSEQRLRFVEISCDKTISVDTHHGGGGGVVLMITQCRNRRPLTSISLLHRHTERQMCGALRRPGCVLTRMTPGSCTVLYQAHNKQLLFNSHHGCVATPEPI